MRKGNSQSAYQRQMGAARSSNRGYSSENTSTFSQSDKDDWLAQQRESRRRAGEALDSRFGYERFGGKEINASLGPQTREGWLFNMVQTVSGRSGVVRICEGFVKDL